MDNLRRKLNKLGDWHWLWLIITVALFARLGSVLIMGDSVEVLPGIFDQVSYHTLAIRLLGGYGFTFATEWWPVIHAGQPTAHWSYLYTFYLTAVYALVGEHPIVARLIQALAAASLMPLLAYRLATHLTSTSLPFPFRGEIELSSTYLSTSSPESGARGEVHSSLPPSPLSPVLHPVPLLAAAWVAAYGYFIYYSAALMTETFYILAILWSLDCALRLNRNWRTAHLGTYLELGLSIGIAVLLRQVYLLFVPFLLAWVVASPALSQPFWPGFLTRLKKVALSTLVLALMILPFTLWNYHQFDQFVLLNTNAGYAFFWANHPLHGDDFVPLFTPDMPSYQQLILAEFPEPISEAALEKQLLRRGIQFVLDDPARYLRLSISRIDDHFIFWPKADSSTLSNVVRVMSLGIALPFMLAGIVVWKLRIFRQQTGSILRRVWDMLGEPGGLLLLFITVYVCAHLFSWAGIRYRLPVDAVMLVFASVALFALFEKIRSFGKAIKKVNTEPSLAEE